MPEKVGFIAKEKIEQVLQATDIVQLIGGYVSLKNSGKNFIGLCPFHNEKTPSFVVSPIRQNYNCYGCGQHGNALGFLMEIENFQFQEAVLFLADRYGIPIRTRRSGSKESGSHSKLTECMRLSFEYYTDNLKKAGTSDAISRYIRQRRISPDLIEKFSLGYSKPDWSDLHGHLNRSQLERHVQESAGLIKKSEKGRYYDRLRNRLTFPIRDAQGRILGFAGREISDELPKYLNPPETVLYKKSNILYGLYEANETIRKRKRVIVVEGYMDVLRLHEFHWNESVATCGTALNEGHIRLIKRLHVSNVVLLFDGDRAGIKAADHSARLFLENDVDCTVVTLPEGLDPDDYFAKYSSEEFQRLLENGSKDFEFIINRAHGGSRSEGMEQQKRILEQMLDLAAKIKSSIKRDLFLAKVSGAFGVQRKSLGHIRKLAIPAPRNDEAVKNLDLFFNKKDEPERELIRYLIKQVQSIKKTRLLVRPDDFGNRELGSLYSRLIQLNDEEFQSLKPEDFPNLYVEYGPLLMSLVQSGSVPRTDAFSEHVLDQIILRFKRHRIERLLNFANQARDTAEERERINKIIELRKSIGHLADRAGKHPTP